MNKIKLMYDVVTKLREKKAVCGDVQVIGMRDESQVLDFRNQFEKNWETGLMKAKIRAEWGCGANKVKHESTTEFHLQCGRDRFHRMQGPMYMHHPHCSGQEGFRRPLNKLAFLLYMLNSLEVVEREDGSLELALDLNEIPEFLETELCEKMERNILQSSEEHHGFIKQFFKIDKPVITLLARVNPNRELERILLTVIGEEQEETSENHEVNLRAEVNLIW